MAKPTRTKAQRLQDLETIAELHRKGKTQGEIAKVLGVSRTQVSYDLQALFRQWKENAAREIAEVRAEQLAKIDLVEREAWRGWDKSMDVRQKQRTSKKSGVQGDGDVNVNSAEIIKEEGLGDPRYLSVVDNCIERRSNLLGLDAPQKVEGVFTIKLPEDYPKSDAVTDAND